MWKSYLNAGLPIRITLNADPEPDPAFNFNEDPDPAFHFNTDPVLVTDPASHHSDGNLRPQVFQTLPLGSILSLQTSIASVRGSPRLYFEPQILLNLYLNADPNPYPALHSNADLDPASEINADLDPQPWLNVWR